LNGSGRCLHTGRPLELPGGGHALFTERAHGNLSSVGGEHAEHGERARDSLRSLIGVRRLARGHQVHGTVVRRLSEPVPPRDHEPEGLEHEQEGLTEADGQATSVTGLGTIVLSADCMPVALGCEGAVAMVHAGWRGLAAGVLEEGVRAIRELGVDSELGAIVGPCAGVCCYRVGAEVHEAFATAHRVASAHRSATARRDGDPIDLRRIAHERLLAAGVAQVRDVPACTICDERFFSYRREGERAGRQGGVAWLR
jgi:polyphenol oxidase